MSFMDAMGWTRDDQIKLDSLRGKELAGTLTEPEQAELAALMARVEADEAAVLAPEMARLRIEANGLTNELGKVEAENEQLARLLAQQEALVADTRRFLDEFDRRRASILDGLARVTGGPLPAA
jgi:predicted RNase H-like nuclease (RuvC/YqgF family)